jgi:hypothetical protein
MRQWSPRVASAQGGAVPLIHDFYLKDSQMFTRNDLQDWVVLAIQANGGSANIVEVAKHIWLNHEKDLQVSGDLFYTWQYDMRWACTRLRDTKIVQEAEVSKRGEWRLA